MEYVYEKSKDKTEEDDKEMEDAPMSRKEARININKLEKQVTKLGEMTRAEFEDIKKQDGSVV
eukprot:14814606-Heterocapsa_arctica.AAC.1